MAVISAGKDMPRSETPLRSDLFPEISPYASGMLAVDGRHTIYREQMVQRQQQGRCRLLLWEWLIEDTTPTIITCWVPTLSKM